MANVYDEVTRMQYLRHRNVCDERSAQIISELIQFMDEVGNLREKIVGAMTRAETAESALVDAKNRIAELEKFVEKLATRKKCSEDREHCASDSGPFCAEHDWFCYEEKIDEARALLTVAAEPPKKENENEVQA